MRALDVRWLAGTMWGVGVPTLAVSAWLASLNPPIVTTQTPETLLETSVWLSTWIGFGLVGALIVRSRPDARIGWILAGITFSVSLAVFAPAYARFALVTDPGKWPLGEVAAWIATWSFLPALLLVVTLVVEFPTGAPSRLGRWVLRTFTAVLSIDAIIFAFRPGPIEGDTPPFNPLGLGGLRPSLDLLTEWLGMVLAAIALVAVVDAILRFRRSSGVERLQFRWFVLAIAAFPVMFVTADGLSGATSGGEGFDLVVVAFAIWGNGTAAAIWVAISRHHLYEINRVISRTVTYAVMTSALLGSYGSLVFLLGALLPVEGDLPVAMSTLATAALFNPLRRRVQVVVDRRFNRARYDAERTVEAFGRGLRSRAANEVHGSLEEVVASTLQPLHLSLWLRERRR